MDADSTAPFSLIGDVVAELARLAPDPDYAARLAGRRVIVVGPAQTLRGSRLGRVIDDYDLVVRFNTVIEYLPFTDELAQDVGTRTDIWYGNNEVLMDGVVGQRLIAHERFAPIAAAVGLKYVVSTNNDFTYPVVGAPAPKCYAEEAEFRRFLAEQQVGAGFRMLYAIPDLIRRWLGGHIGRTGFIALVDLLSYDLARLHIIGMTFYHQGGHLFLRDSVSELHPLGNHRGELPERGILGHNSYLELEAMRVLARHSHSKLELDAQLQHLLASHAGSI